MKYQKIKQIKRIRKPDGWWVQVVFENGTLWIPALYDLSMILNEIGFCESIKYIDGEGYRYTQRFFNDVFQGGYKTEEEIVTILRRYDPNFKMQTIPCIGN